MNRSNDIIRFLSKVFVMRNLCLAFLFLSSWAFAQNKTFVKEYTYNASEADSKVTCRALAINELRSQLLNELGVYVESNQLLTTNDVKGKFSQDFKENISTLTAGITKLDVIDEKWTGETYWMKASITVDTTSLKESLKRLSEDHQRTRELEEMKKRLDEANQQIEKLNTSLIQQKEESAKAAIVQRYNTQVNAISATNFFYSGRSKFEHGDLAGAKDDFDKALSLDSTFAVVYGYRGHVYQKQGDYTSSIADFSHAIRQHPRFDAFYFNRGWSYFLMENTDRALADFTKAIQLSPYYIQAYTGRGEVKLKLKDYRAAMTDFNMAISLNSRYALAYFGRGIAREALGVRGGCDDLERAAQLGSREAEEFRNKHCR